MSFLVYIYILRDRPTVMCYIMPAMMHFAANRLLQFGFWALVYFS